KKKLGGGEGKTINDTLGEQGIPHIRVKDVQYVVLSDREKVVSHDAPILAQNSAGQKALGEMVAGFDNLIASTADTEARDQLRAEMADQLLGMDTDMLRCGLAAVAQRSGKATPNELR